MSELIKRFQYHALAAGFSGHIDQPFQEIIPIQASVALPETGGFGSASVGDFRFRDIVSFRSAHAVVVGNYSPPLSYSELAETSPKPVGSYDSLATVTIEGLDILGMVTAERIVARIASSHPEDGREPSITPLGSHFEGVTIGGRPVRVHLADDTFAEFDRYSSILSAYENNKRGFRDEFNNLSLVGATGDLPERLRKHLPWYGAQPTAQIPERNGIISCSLVREIEGLGREMHRFGHAICIKGFGVIRLAEFKITGSSRRITMLQVDLGSTPKGGTTAGGAEGNGSGW